MKKIEIYAIHPGINDLQDMLGIVGLYGLEKKFEFVWNKYNPQYLIVSEHIYYKKKFFKQLCKYKKKGVITIFWPGECIFPDMNIFDYAICWDSKLVMNDRIVRIMPTDVMSACFKVAGRQEINYEEAYKIVKTKKKFCNFIYSNPDAYPMRDRLYYKISEYKHVDSLGKHLNNVKEKGTGFIGHFQEATILKDDYKFSIAAENARYNGYTSEKIFTSLQAHTIPIYWGNPDIADDFNENAFINVNRYDSLDEVMEEIKRIDNSDELWCQMVSEPWQTDEQKEKSKIRMGNYLSFFEKIFSQPYEEAERIPQGYHPSRYKRWFYWRDDMWRIEGYDLYLKIKNKLLRYGK